MLATNTNLEIAKLSILRKYRADFYNYSTDIMLMDSGINTFFPPRSYVRKPSISISAHLEKSKTLRSQGATSRETFNIAIVTSI